MDEDERAVGRIAPAQRRERDAGGRGREPDPPAGSAPSSAAATAGGRSAAVATIALGKVADIGPTVPQADVESESQAARR